MLSSNNDNTQEDILESIAQTYVVLPQYTRAHYSNFGVSLLGRTLGTYYCIPTVAYHPSLERAAGVKYETYVEQHILAPLGMSNSTFEYNAELRAKMVTVIKSPSLI
jgi:hypothetical protein